MSRPSIMGAEPAMSAQADIAALKTHIAMSPGEAGDIHDMATAESLTTCQRAEFKRSRNPKRFKSEEKNWPHVTEESGRFFKKRRKIFVNLGLWL